MFPGPDSDYEKARGIDDMYVHDWKDAEVNAARYLRALGFDDAQTTVAGADRGIDVRATGALGQVKHESRPIGAPAVQKLVGARALETNADLFFFSLNGFTAKAITYGDQMDVALSSMV